MEVFKGYYNHAGFLKNKKEKKRPFQESALWIFIYVSQIGPKFVKTSRSSTYTLPCLCC